MKKLALAAVLTFAAATLAPDGASAAPTGIPSTMIDLDVKQASVRQVFNLLAQLSKRKITVDPCVTKLIDMRLQKAPLPVVYDVLAMKLDLNYDEEPDDSIIVHCNKPNGEDNGEEDDVDIALAKGPSLVTRVSVNATELPLPDVLGQIAASAKMRVDYRAKTKPAVTMSLKDVRLGTAVQAVTESSGIRVAVRGDVLVVADGS